MIIMKAEVNYQIAQAIYKDGLAAHLDKVKMRVEFDNFNPSSGNGLPDFTITDKGMVIAAKHRFELSKFLKTNGDRKITCGGRIAVDKGSYYSGGIFALYAKKAVAGPVATAMNVRHILMKAGTFATTASLKHNKTKEGIKKNGFFIMVFPAEWLIALDIEAHVFMMPSNETTFASLASMAGPSFAGGIKDQSSKLEGPDWFHVDKRRNAKAMRSVVEWDVKNAER